MYTTLLTFLWCSTFLVFGSDGNTENDDGCFLVGGVCKPATSCVGTTQAGVCSDNNHTCCIPNDDQKCTNRGGMCEDDCSVQNKTEAEPATLCLNGKKCCVFEVVERTCLDCICLVEGFECNIPNPLCKDDGGSDACGPYQIHEDYWIDATPSPGGGKCAWHGANSNKVGWQECARSVKCSEQAINNYMKRYAKQHTCEEHARRHNGGSLTSCTSQYWWMVQTCLEENKCEGNGGKCIEPDECCRGTGISNRPGLQFCTEGKKCCTQKGDGLCTDCSGECIPDCLDCDLGEFISGLCPGDHYKCCRRNLANGERCHRRGGKCMQDTQAITCDGTYGGTYTPLLCPGTETCCIPNGGANCEAKGGICTNSKFKCNTLHGADWQYDNDNTLCPAPNAPFNQRCCVPVGDTMCIEAGGVCEDSSMKECCCEQDKKEFKLGMCALGNDPTCERKCCLNTGVACGDPHYTTLDGRKFSYQGTCSYVLMQDCVNVPPMFSVEAASVPGVHKGKIVTRISSVKLRLGNNIIDLVKDRVTLINGVKLRSKRSTVDSYNTTIENDGHNVKLNMEGFFTLMWNGQHRVEIIPGKNIKGKVCGLLGNNDDDPSNDFHTSLGILTKNVHQFAESWKVPYSC